MRKVLVPPPATQGRRDRRGDGRHVLRPQEAPHLPPFVTKGAHFDKGDPLYIIEVMKMFNKVYAPFAGTVTEVLVRDSGVVVRKGQPLFRIQPDEKVVRKIPPNGRGASAPTPTPTFRTCSSWP